MFRLLVVLSLLSPLARAGERPSVAALVAQFDRELDESPAATWSLESSEAYQQLTMIHAQYHGATDKTARFEPGWGQAGQLSGGEFPKNTWAITYDDGPHKAHTDKILAVLATFNIKATFFWVAENVLRYGSVIANTEAAGHSPQHHSYSHPNLVKITDKELAFEVSLANHIMKLNYTEEPRYFRLPFGSGGANSRVRKKIASEKLISVLWNVDSLDWSDKNPVTVAERVRKQMVKLGRGIVLFHDIHGHTALATEKLLKAVEHLPYKYQTIANVVEDLNLP